MNRLADWIPTFQHALDGKTPFPFEMLGHFFFLYRFPMLLYIADISAPFKEFFTFL